MATAARRAGAGNEGRGQVAADIAEMLSAWKRVVSEVRRRFPRASDEEVYQIAKGAMNRSLGLDAAGEVAS